MRSLIYRKARLDVYKVVGRNFSVRIGKPIRATLKTAFRRIRKVATENRYTATMKYPLMLLFSILMKYLNRSYNAGFNQILRLDHSFLVDHYRSTSRDRIRPVATPKPSDSPPNITPQTTDRMIGFDAEDYSFESPTRHYDNDHSRSTSLGFIN
jgi:hypothetical protein